MKNKNFLIILIMFFLSICNTYASVYTGKVTRINVREEDGLVWVYIAGARNGNVPSCATNWYMVIKNENSPAGKRQLAMLMLAKASNKSVLIEGANTCNRWGDGEDISMVAIE